jgi:hypothetical protein
MHDIHALFQQCCGIDTADVAVPHKLLRLNASERNAHVINQVATQLLTQVQSAAGTIPPPQLQWMTQQVINARNAMLVQCAPQVQSPTTMTPVPPPVPQGHQYQSPVANPPIVVRTAVRRPGNASGAETALGVFGIIAMLTAAGFLGFLFRDQLFGSAKSPVSPRPPSPVVVPLVVPKGGGAGETVPGQAPELPPARPRPAPPARPGRIADAQSHIKNAFSNLRKGFFDEADLDAQKALAVSPGLDEAEAIQAYVQQMAGENCDVILGMGHDPNLGDKIAVTVIATGFNYREVVADMPSKNKEPEKINFKLEDKFTTLAINEAATQQKTEALQPVDLAPTLVEMEPTKPIEVYLRERNEATFEAPIAEASEPLQYRNYFEETPAEDNGMKLFVKEEAPVEEEPKVIIGERVLSADEIEERRRFEAQKRALEERAERLRSMSFKIKGSESNDDMENQPAYLRKNINLDNANASSSTHMSGYRVGNDGNSQPGIQTINTYLDGKRPD